MKNTFTIPIIPPDDEERLKALYRYEILDTPPEGAFNRLAELAVKIFKVPMALISLVDKERVFFKAKVGMAGDRNVERGVSLCSLAVLQAEPTVFENAAKEPCLLSNPLVAGSFGLKFYAGAPLVTSDGHHIGTFCLVDKAPREFYEEEKKKLQDLAAIVMDEIEIRISSIKALRAQSDLMYIAAHDLKNPLQSIMALSDQLKKVEDPDLRKQYTGLIHDSSVKMISLINRMVKLSEIENQHFSLELKPVNAAEIVKEVIEANEIGAERKDQQIKLQLESSQNLYLDSGWIQEIFDNLINNAVKYSPKGKEIHVILKATPDGLLFSVQDEGAGFSEEDKSKAFKKFSRLSSVPTGGESSTGLGLSIVKTLVELHKGTVWIDSKGKNKGSKIIVRIPNLKKEAERQKIKNKKRQDFKI